MMRLLKLILVLALLVVVTGVYFTLRTPTHLFRFSGSFQDCPARPSCVSSVATDAPHAIAPLSFRGEPQAVADQLEQLINADPQGEVVYREPGYLHAVYVSPIMRYHDDLELLIQPDGVIQVRSISRFGYRDFDVNRNRVEALRAALAAAAAEPAAP
jgi:uncharacterized protein (DUF1499 family)